MKKSTKVALKFVQQTKNGERVLEGVPFDVPTIKCNEVGYTIANMILEVKASVTRGTLRLKGFSFHRKFEVFVSIDDREFTSIAMVEKAYQFGGLDQAQTHTIQNKAESFKKFSDDVCRLVTKEMKGDVHVMISTADELRKTINGGNLLAE